MWTVAFAALPTTTTSLSLGYEFPPRNRFSALLQSRSRLEAPSASSHRFLSSFSGLPRPAWLFSGDFSRPPLGGCLPKSRTGHCPRHKIDPGLLLSCRAEVAPGIPCAGSQGVSLLTTSPTAPAAVWPTTVRFYVAKAKAAIA